MNVQCNGIEIKLIRVTCTRTHMYSTMQTEQIQGVFAQQSVFKYQYIFVYQYQMDRNEWNTALYASCLLLKCHLILSMCI